MLQTSQEKKKKGLYCIKQTFWFKLVFATFYRTRQKIQGKTSAQIRHHEGGPCQSTAICLLGCVNWTGLTRDGSQLFESSLGWKPQRKNIAGKGLDVFKERVLGLFSFCFCFFLWLVSLNWETFTSVELQQKLPTPVEWMKLILQVVITTTLSTSFSTQFVFPTLHFPEQWKLQGSLLWDWHPYRIRQ